mgnify:FL=1
MASSTPHYFCCLELSSKYNSEFTPVCKYFTDIMGLCRPHGVNYQLRGEVADFMNIRVWIC